MHQASQPKNTPGRSRRGGRNGTPQKTYASENDMPNYRQVQPDSPCTPQKLASGNAAATQNVQSTNQKQRSKATNKPRNKTGAASPGANVNKLERQSPSFVAPAFAGATFHHSPAPSALPIPSFLSRTFSAPDSPSQRASPAEATQEPSPPTTDSEDAGELSPPPNVPRNDDSPLEVFFKAQRDEKARTRRASSANAVVVALGPFSPPNDSPQACNTLPKATAPAPPRRPQASRNQSSGISSNELNGIPGEPLGPAFSTPYQDRIRAARSNNNSGQATPTSTRSSAQKVDFDRSEALKRYLFAGKLGPSPQLHQQQKPQPQPQHRQQPVPSQDAHPKMPRGMFPATVLGGNPNPPATQPQYQAATGLRPDQMRTMEDSLRKVLKLDSVN
ncbi:uncharacterized protein BCR38DRAFT_86326 [Pseudomassariella vexata]|uniref:Proteophosphoglycan 5 n=1 Tax=Pseudomassariella vexata TaxID=1141098 RepID=A0A1Y2ED23_9PEZI|nr:uncharacterized protein BCR38DRAFT_86326 [Pseudomassariella vexata]ORY69479.1 hypothetical protein BCR38DRAFT_86326 [Pseudomassariella vexata]